MHIVLINLDFATEDIFKVVGKILRINDLVIGTYSEARPSTLVNTANELWCNGSILCSHENLKTLNFMAPGYQGVKLHHDIINLMKTRDIEKVSLGISLPEHWKFRELEKNNRFQYESFRTYLATSVSLGYPLNMITCISEPCAEFYTQNILGGFKPPALSPQALFETTGLIQPYYLRQL